MFILANYDVVSKHYYVNGFSIGRGIASGGERVTDCKGPRGLGGPAIAYWPSRARSL